MTTLMIVAHEPLATALRDVARHAFPEAADAIVAIDVGPHEHPEGVALRIRSSVPTQGSALILCDALGATPCNAAQRLVQDGRLHVVTGVNVPMVWRALCYAGEPLVTQTQRALSGAIDGAMILSSSTLAHEQATRCDQQ